MKEHEIASLPKEQELHTEFLSFESEGDAVLIDRVVAIRYIFRRHRSLGEFVIASKNPLRIIRQERLERGDFSQRENQSTMNIMLRALNKDPATNVYIGENFQDYKVCFVARSGKKCILSVESKHPLKFQRYSGVHQIEDILLNSDTLS